MLVIIVLILFTVILFLFKTLSQKNTELATKESQISTLIQAENEIIPGESERLDINNDGILDLRVKMVDGKFSSLYSYYLGTDDDTNFVPILFNGRWQSKLGPEIRITDEFLISITPEKNGVTLDAHIYEQQKPNTIPNYFIIQWLYQPKTVSEFSEEVLNEYVSWIKKTNQTQVRKGVRIRVSDSQARELILDGQIAGGFISHSPPITINGFDGTVYELWSKTGGETILNARDECGQVCKFMSFGIE